MKIFRDLFLLLIVGIIIIGVCGCMSTKMNDYENELKQYAEEKYNKTFDIVSIEEAILLSDKSKQKRSAFLKSPAHTKTEYPERNQLSISVNTSLKES